MKEPTLFQELSGGLIPTSPLQCKIVPCQFRHIRHIFERYHYKGGNMGGGISICFALMFNENVIGGAVLGKPRHEKKYPNSMEIRRMAIVDESPKNSESYFLGKICWYMKKYSTVDCLLSFADLSVGHTGTIYKAANFEKVAETAPTLHIFWRGKRYHPRSLTINRPYSYKLREAIKTGEAQKEIGKPKTLWMYQLRTH